MKVVRNVPYLSPTSLAHKDTKNIIYQGGINPGRGFRTSY